MLCNVHRYGAHKIKLTSFNCCCTVVLMTLTTDQQCLSAHACYSMTKMAEMTGEWPALKLTILILYTSESCFCTYS